MAKKDYASELAELRERLEKAEQEAETMKEEAEKYEGLYRGAASKQESFRAELKAVKIEIMRVKAHAYDLMMEQG